jgi:hypothetical protein
MRALLSIATCLLLSSCTPAVYLNVYNATDSILTIAKAQFRPIVTIPPHASADLPLPYQPGERVVISSARRSWTYLPRSLFPPPSMYQQHTGVMRAFARIDAHGQIYLLAPPADGGSPRETPQPAGFPVKPQRPNQAMELTASRRIIQLSITSISQLAATRAFARGSSSCSR